MLGVDLVILANSGKLPRALFFTLSLIEMLVLAVVEEVLKMYFFYHRQIKYYLQMSSAANTL